MKSGTRVLFVREKVLFSSEPGGLAQVTLDPIEAVYVEDSPALCEICRDPEATHARPKRQHAFSPMKEPGITIDVHYPGGPIERRENVQHGTFANGWVEL